MTLHAQALHLHTFLEAASAVETVDALVEACVDLGMTEVAEDHTVRPGGPWPRWLRSSPLNDRIYQALRYDTARLTAVLVCLAAAGKARTSWKELDRQWPAPVADGIGRVRLFYALYDGDGDEARLLTEAREALPGEPELAFAAKVENDIFLWEYAGGAGDRIDRTLVLLAPVTRENAADTIVWPSADAALPPLPGYLWHMAIVRHESRQLARRHVTSPPSALNDLAAEFASAESSGSRGADERDRQLDVLQRRTALAAAEEAALRTAHRTVEAAVANARAFLTPLPGDRDHAAWLLTEVQDAADGLRDAVAYAEPLTRIGLAETEKRLRDLSARSEFLTLLQTSVIAAATLALAASQALDFDWPTYASLQTPFIVAVTLLGLACPMAAAALSPYARRRTVLVATAVVAGLGAALGWFLCTWWVRSHSEIPPDRPVTSVAAAAMAAVAVAVGWALRTWMRSRHKHK